MQNRQLAISNAKAALRSWLYSGIKHEMLRICEDGFIFSDTKQAMVVFLKENGAVDRVVRF